MRHMERLRRKFSATPQLSSVLTICLLLVVIFLSMCAYSESYRSLYNITNVLAQCAPLACVSLGQTIVIISALMRKPSPMLLTASPGFLNTLACWTNTAMFANWKVP